MESRSSSKSSIAAFVASASTIVLFPLEKAKLHIMVSDGHSKNYIPYYKHSFEVFKQLHSQGFRNLYRGCHFHLANSVAWSTYFFVYESCKKVFPETYKHSSPNLYRFTLASCASVVTNFIINPLMVMKTRALLLRNSENWVRDTWESCVKTWKVDGVTGFWRGYLPGLVLSLNGSMTIFFYEVLKENLENYSWCNALAGGGSKLCATSLFYPITLVKTRLQQEQYSETILLSSKVVTRSKASKEIYGGIYDCFRQILSFEGFRGFYRGLPITLARVVPAHALFFSVYERVFNLITS